MTETIDAELNSGYYRFTERMKNMWRWAYDIKEKRNKKNGEEKKASTGTSAGSRR